MKETQSPLFLFLKPKYQKKKSTPDRGWAAFTKCMFSAVCAVKRVHVQEKASISYLLLFVTSWCKLVEADAVCGVLLWFHEGGVSISVMSGM